MFSLHKYSKTNPHLKQIHRCNLGVRVGAEVDDELGPMIVHVHDNYIDNIRFPTLSNDISLSVTVFVSEIHFDISYISLSRLKNRSISVFRKKGTPTGSVDTSII